MRAFGPDMIFLSAGFDAHKDDPLSSARLEHADFAWLTKEVAALVLPSTTTRLDCHLLSGLTKEVTALVLPSTTTHLLSPTIRAH